MSGLVLSTLHALTYVLQQIALQGRDQSTVVKSVGWNAWVQILALLHDLREVTQLFCALVIT